MEDIEIVIFIKNKGNLLANANLILKTSGFGNIVIKGLPIWKSSRLNERLQENINITPPSRQSYGRYIDLVFFENRKIWFEIERLVYSAYLKKKNKTVIVNESVDPKDIPF